MIKKRSTVQKRLIFSELKARCDHPSVADLYDDLQQKNPKISRSTVYRVLNDAADSGEVIRIHAGAQDHFEGRLHPHCHLICTDCGTIRDEELPTDALDGLVKRSGFSLSGSHAEFYGICPACLKVREKKEQQ